jgi:hypothetical protein
MRGSRLTADGSNVRFGQSHPSRYCNAAAGSPQCPDQQGKVKALAVSTSQRDRILPSVPAIAESCFAAPRNGVVGNIARIGQAARG